MKQNEVKELERLSAKWRKQDPLTWHQIEKLSIHWCKIANNPNACEAERNAARAAVGQAVAYQRRIKYGTD